MSATIWVSTARDETIELGGTLALYQAFQEMARAAGSDWLTRWSDLAGVPSQTEDTADAAADWLADACRQAGQFLAQHGRQLRNPAREILQQLAAYPAGRTDVEGKP